MTIIGPGNTISQMSEELCLLIVCRDFRNAVWEWLCQIGDCTLFVLTLGKKKKKNNNNNNCSLFIRRTNGTVGAIGDGLVQDGNGNINHS
jgi:hypothetical protein